MNDLRDDLTVAVMNADWDRAIHLIERIKEEPIADNEGVTSTFTLMPDEVNEFERTTCFLPFHGWEAA